MGFDSIRALQKEIQRERNAGAVILSSTEGGYYLPGDEQEVKQFVKTLENRAKNTFLALRSARNFIRQREGEDARR